MAVVHRTTRTTRPGGTDAGDAVIELTDVFRVYREVDVETIALRGVDLRVGSGEFVAIMGRSGSGKSTLLQLMAGMDRPTAGRVVVDGVDLAQADETRLAAIRGARIGLVFQRQNLVPFLTLGENVLLAAQIGGRDAERHDIESWLGRVGLGDRAGHRPDQLSGGEQQRAALAMVAFLRPAVILADEITGELDTVHAAKVLDLLSDLHIVEGMTVVLATHDPAVARRADRCVELRDGHARDMAWRPA